MQPVRHSHRPAYVLLTVLIAFALTVAAACGSSSSTDTEAGSGSIYTGPAASLEEGMQGLYEAAQANGETSVTIAISDTSGDEFDEFVAKFQEDFPDVEVILKQTDFIQMGSIVQAELDAGQSTADVVTNAFLALKPLLDSESIDSSIDWEALGVSPERVAEQGFVYQSDGLCTSVVYNSDLIEESELPTDFEGFLDPRWRDTMATLPSNSVACMGFYALMHGQDETAELVEALRDNGLIFSNDAEQLMLSGERPVIPFHFSLSAPLLEAQGAPVAEKLYPGTGVFRTRAAVVEGTSSPNLARLFTVWLTGDDATAIDENYFMGGQGFVADPDSLLVVRTQNLGQDPTDTSFFVYETLANFSDRADAATRFREIFLGG